LSSEVTLPVGIAGRLPARMAALATILGVELVAISLWLDNDVLRDGIGLTRMVHDWGAWAVRLAVAIAVIGLVFGESRSRGQLVRISAECSHGISWTLLGGHVAAMAGFVALSAMLFASHSGSANLLVVFWLFVGVLAILLAAGAFVPAASWMELIRGTGNGFLYAIMAALIACVLGEYAWKLWAPLSRWTFRLVEIMLVPFVPSLMADPATFTIGTPGFQVEIAPQCSGYEGMGLMLVFSTAWLWFLRRQWRFPHALLLVPVGVAAMFVLNSGRIAALILIGNGGAPSVALGGFHSQAGWLAFNGVALGLCVAARRIQWITKSGEAAMEPVTAGRDATAAYLTPFLAILAAAMVSRGMSADFEWSYSLRVIAAGAALWYFRKTYQTMNWRIGWPAVAVGTLVFAIWIGLEMLAGTRLAPAPAALMQASLGARIAWIAIRLMGAVITVPIAEEIAFRGFLLRRLTSGDFESVSLRSFRWLPLLISSGAFGLLHGDRWLAGTIAGMLYAVVMIRRGRIGEAVAAHAITNALVAAWVLLTANWQLW
jgi:exosortase E/protease (VPEID-CTERM system)